MSQGDLYTVRMAIQEIGIEEPAYRLVVYGDRVNPRHTDFSNAKSLVEALRSAIPDFDLSHLTMNPLREGKGSMVFAGENTLDALQLAVLGFR